NWFTRADGLPLLVRDLRTGRASLVLRVALSLAAAATSASLAMGVLGIIEIGGTRVDDGEAFAAMWLAVMLWCGSLVWLWSGYRRWQRTIRTAFGLIAFWALLAPLCAAIGALIHPADFLIGACVIFGIGVTLAVIATAAYRSRGGKQVRDQTGCV